MGILLAEQNVDLALSVADRVDVIGDGGALSWSGAPAALRADEALDRPAGRPVTRREAW